MTVEQKIKTIVDQMEGITYVFGNWNMVNVMLEKIRDVEMPVFVNLLPMSGSFNLGKTQLKDYPNCMFAFLHKTNLDFDASDNDSIIERCKDYAIEFVLRLNESSLFEQIDENIHYSVYYDLLDINMTGISIEVQLKETKGLVLCHGKDIGELVHERKG